MLSVPSPDLLSCKTNFIRHPVGTERGVSRHSRLDLQKRRWCLESAQRRKRLFEKLRDAAPRSSDIQNPFTPDLCGLPDTFGQEVYFGGSPVYIGGPLLLR